MIRFEHLDISHKAQYDEFLKRSGKEGCEYNFNNLYLWGRQRIAFHEGNVALFSQFDRKSVYPFPVSGGDLKPTLDAIIHDAATRDIPCRLTGLSKEDCRLFTRIFEEEFVDSEELEKILETAEIIEKRDTDKVGLGTTVKIKYLEEDDEDVEEYRIVGSKEADPSNNKISNESPLAKAIMGAKAGDERTVDSPNGSYRVEIVEIM